MLHNFYLEAHKRNIEISNNNKKYLYEKIDYLNHCLENSENFLLASNFSAADLNVASIFDGIIRLKILELQKYKYFNHWIERCVSRQVPK